MSEADCVAELMRMYQKLIKERNKNNENKSEIVINYFVVRVSDWATCNFLSPNLRIQTDANTQWYKASIITSQMNDTHTWTDWKIVDEPTCTEDGKIQQKEYSQEDYNKSKGNNMKTNLLKEGVR